jgi:hypothetical protein
MTNPIPEYIDKRKAEIAETPRKELNGHAFLLEQEQVKYEEEIAKLKSWLKNSEAKERHYDELRRWFNNMEARALQAEQERDEAIGKLYDAEQTIEHWEMTLLRWREEERNALLEGLKWYADEANWKARSRCGNCGHHLDADLPEDSAEFDAGGKARSIIAKLEGSESGGTD